MHSMLLIIVGTSIVTFLVKTVPFFIPVSDKIPLGIKRFLSYIPYAALGALIFPGVIQSFPERPLAGILGISTAAFVSWFRGGLLLPVFSSVIITYVVLEWPLF